MLGDSEHDIFNLEKLLYVIFDSKYYFNFTIDSQLNNELKMERAVWDSKLYVKMTDGKLSGITGNYDKDNLNAGNEKL